MKQTLDLQSQPCSQECLASIASCCHWSHLSESIMPGLVVIKGGVDNISSAGIGWSGHDAVEGPNTYCVYDICICALLRGAAMVCDDNEVVGARPWRPIILRRNLSITCRGGDIEVQGEAVGAEAIEECTSLGLRVSGLWRMLIHRSYDRIWVIVDGMNPFTN